MSCSREQRLHARVPSPFQARAGYGGQRIMIGTEISRCPPTMTGGVEHAAEVNGVDRTAVHADSDEATRKLVHHHEHPLAPEHDRLTSKEVDAPEAVCGVANERQP